MSQPNTVVLPPRRWSWSGAMLWAAVGAALFLGIGAALPVWEGDELQYGPIWWAVCERVNSPRYLHAYGVSKPLLTVRAAPLAGPLLLLTCGALAGLLGYLAWRRVRQQKGGAT